MRLKRNREQPVACEDCGYGPWGHPRHETYNDSGVCDRHEARREAVQAQIDLGYGPQVAEQIVARISGEPIPPQRRHL